MGIPGIVRRFRPAGMALLLGLWALSPLSGILRDTLARLQGPGEAVAERIEAPGSELVICHHHLEGCPKDCFCPKIKPGGQDVEDHDHHHDAPYLKEPSLVRCTEGQDQGLPPALLAFWSAAPSALPDLDGAGEYLLLSPPPSPRDPFLAPPYKVPRS